MGKVLLLCWVAVLCIMVIVIVDRYRLERLRYEYDELRFEVESRDGRTSAQTAKLRKGREAE